MSQKYFTHASPTLFNAGTPVPQMSSCFLVHMKEDSSRGHLRHAQDVRADLEVLRAGSDCRCTRHPRSQGRTSAGRTGRRTGSPRCSACSTATARYVDQGGGKRPGAFAMYLEPWHPDIHDFLDLRKNTGSEENRCRDLFLALWVSDLFMKRVEEKQRLVAFLPVRVPGAERLLWGGV